jgi:serine/threonine-protein kinase
VRDDQAALLWAHLAVDPPAVSTHRGDLADADAVIARCLAKSPNDRYETCGEFVAALADAMRTGRHSVAAAGSDRR